MKNDSFNHIHEVLYYCWLFWGMGRRILPFYISATQLFPRKLGNISSKSAFTNLDNELIKPVMDSLEFHLLPDDVLKFIFDEIDRACYLNHRLYYNKYQGSFPDRRMITGIMRDCGYEVPDSQITVDSYDN